MIRHEEYTASRLRMLLQELFPHRRLVLSQFTFFNHVGISIPTGSTFQRGRRCYRLSDVLPIACVLALKEEGIPYKNIEKVPELIRVKSEEIFIYGPGVMLSGFGENISLRFSNTDKSEVSALDQFLSAEESPLIFWSYDIGKLASQLKETALKLQSQASSKVVLRAA